MKNSTPSGQGLGGGEGVHPPASPQEIHPCLYKWVRNVDWIPLALICSCLHSQGRIVAMTLDVEHTVSVVAIKLVLLLFRYVVSNTCIYIL